MAGSSDSAGWEAIGDDCIEDVGYGVSTGRLVRLSFRRIVLDLWLRIGLCRIPWRIGMCLLVIARVGLSCRVLRIVCDMLWMRRTITLIWTS